tara:strand:+ start:276 stop:1127 length:852 start_codon:yes stop_codon:yes gene_type:complete
LINNTVIFNHIPKTAGLTLSAIIRKQYSKDREFSTLGWDGGRREAINYFKNISETKRNKFSLITGHSALELFNFVKSPIILIMLRHPVDRVISLYSYVKRKSWHKFYNITNQYSLSECYENNIHHDWKELSNGQSLSLISIINKIKFDSNNCDIDNLEELKLFMERFCLVGLVEKFDESLILFRERLNWMNNIYYHKINVSREKPDLNPKIRQIILDYNKTDYELYNYTLQNFEDLVNSLNTNFNKRVESFKSKNEFLMPLMIFKNKLNYYVRRISNQLKTKL